MLINIENVSKQYSNHTALDGVSVQIPEQSIFGLLGPNGAGKTSLIRILTQITQADSGVITFNGNPLAAKHIYEMGYLPEERGLYKKMKVGEQLLYFAQLKGLSIADAKSRLKYWIDKFEIRTWLGKKVEELSKGMQQKVQFIATVLHEPKLLILDEPFSGFDPVNAQLLTEEILQLCNNGATILFSTHRMESVESLCSHIALINRSKKVLDGEVSEIKNRFKTNNYVLEYANGTLQPSSLFTVLSDETTGANAHKASLHINNEITNNELLSTLLSQVDIKSFSEKLPTMEEIFIKAVSTQN